MMDIASWLREVRMSTNTSDWNAAFVNNRLDEAANEIERLQKQIRYQEHRDGQKSPDYYLHIPMACITALASKEISAKAWPLALWVLWQYRVSGGKPVTISTTFAQKAGVEGRSARRHAVNALEATGLFVVTRDGTEAAKIAPGEDLKTTM